MDRLSVPILQTWRTAYVSLVDLNDADLEISNSFKPIFL
jgi:hypothetical protein